MPRDSIGRAGAGSIVGTLAILLLPAGPAAAQQEGAIAGSVVTAETLEPVSGAQVFVPGTELGTLTDREGRYRLTGVPAGEVELHVRLIGSRPATRSVTVRAGQTTTAEFELEVSAIRLEEVVATITGEQRRREIGNAVTVLAAAEEMERSDPSDLLGLLQGRSSSVAIQQTTGSVGTGRNIKIRGASSISLDNTPLLVVDGAIANSENRGISGQAGQVGSRLNDINPEDIESIEIVKGPSAAALWGSRANAGVIKITTKRGRAGRTDITFRGEAAANWQDSDFPEVAYNPTDDPLATLPFGKDTVYRFDPLDDGAPGFEVPFRTGLHNTAAVSIRGGIDDVTYYVSGEREFQEGTLPDNFYERWSARGNFSFTPSEKLDVQVSNGFVSNRLRLPQNDNNAFGYLGNALISFAFFWPFERPDPNAGGEPVLTCPLAFEIARGTGQPLAEASEQNCDSPLFFFPSYDDISLLEDRQAVERYTGSATVNWRPLQGWTNRFTVGYDEFSESNVFLQPVVPRLLDVHSDFNGLISKDNSLVQNITLEAVSSYTRDLAPDLAAEVTGGLQFFKDTRNNAGALGRVFPVGSPAVNNSVTNEGDDFFFEERTLGFFFQGQLSWKDRLFVTPGARVDDNSAFGEELEAQWYPRLTVSYVVSDESGFPELFDELRLRAAWGRSGKQPGTNDALALLTPVSVPIDGDEVLGVVPNRPGNPLLEPETGEEIEAGFDATVLDGRLGLDFTYYFQETSDAIVQKNLAPSTGFPNQVFTNIGAMENEGVELGLAILALDGADVTWEWRVAFATNDNVIARLDNPIIFGDQRHTEGFPFGSFFAEEVVIGPDGEPTVLTCEEDPGRGCDPTDDHRFLGQQTPKWDGSVNTSIRLFDRFTLYGLLDFQGGHHLTNNTESFRCAFVLGLCAEIFEEGPDGELTDDATIKRHAAAIGSEAPWFEEADFARLRTASLRVDVPDAWARRLGADRARVSFAGENLALWTAYGGIDPETNSDGARNTGLNEFLTLPPSKRFVGTLEITF